MKTMYSGVIGADLSSLLNGNKPLTLRMAVICGTSSCHMAVSIELKIMVTYHLSQLADQIAGHANVMCHFCSTERIEEVVFAQKQLSFWAELRCIASFLVTLLIKTLIYLWLRQNH